MSPAGGHRDLVTKYHAVETTKRQIKRLCAGLTDKCTQDMGMEMGIERAARCEDQGMMMGRGVGGAKPDTTY